MRVSKIIMIIVVCLGLGFAIWFCNKPEKKSETSTIEKAFSGQCTKVPTYKEIKRGEKCK